MRQGTDATPASTTVGVSVTASGSPSVLGLDRSNWAGMMTGPARGTTYHQPAYFADVPMKHHLPSVLEREPSAESLEQALAGTRSSTLLRDGNAIAIFVQPLKFAYDLIVLPGNAVLLPPWRTVTSPPGSPGPLSDWPGRMMAANQQSTDPQESAPSQEPAVGQAESTEFASIGAGGCSWTSVAPVASGAGCSSITSPGIGRRRRSRSPTSSPETIST
jgi:hypothetical protein